jgi:ABC-type polar amino acid transport system ATPase subunit
MSETINSQEIIICRDVHKWFDQFHVLKGISLTVQKGEVIVIFGPSGSGKSTFIRCLNRLEEHQKGQIIVDGIELGNDIRNVEKIRQEVGMVFQQFNLFPHLTVIQNITLAPSWVKLNKPINIPPNSRVDNNNALRSPVRWLCNRVLCFSMNPLLRSIPR